jgi:hypothetical protein
MKNKMLRILVTGLLSLLAFAAEAQKPQVMYATLQVAQQPSQFLSAALKASAEAGRGFFVVTGNSIQVGRASYLMGVSTGTVKTGSTITLKGTDGRFLGCCNQGAATSSSTTAASQLFIIRLYTAAQVSEFQAKNRAAHDPNAASGFSALEADDGAGK